MIINSEMEGKKRQEQILRFLFNIFV